MHGTEMAYTRIKNNTRIAYFVPLIATLIMDHFKGPERTYTQRIKCANLHD